MHNYKDGTIALEMSNTSRQKKNAMARNFSHISIADGSFSKADENMTKMFYLE